MSYQGSTALTQGIRYHLSSSTPVHGDSQPEGPPRPRLFSGISPTDYATSCRAARVKEFDRGEMLHFEGDAVRRVILVVSGYVKSTKLGPGGEEVIVRLAGPGDVLGAVDLFSSGTHCTAAQ